MSLVEIVKQYKGIFINLAILVIGVTIGWLTFGNKERPKDSLTPDHGPEAHQVDEVWTCSMHPQIRDDGPGQCPICGMDLVQIQADDAEAGQFEVKLSDAAMRIAEVATVVIERKSPDKEIYLPGKVVADERRISELTARFPGRIEELMVNFTGQRVRKGQVLARIYSPQLVTAQKELSEAYKYRDSNPKYYRAVRQKLKLWDLSDEQIRQVEQTEEAIFHFEILSPISGTVTNRHVSLGDYVKEGFGLFEVIDFRHVWVVFDAYESDLPWIELGDQIAFGIKSIPGKKFEATISFIDPVVNQMTRATGLRAELANPDGILKPQMLASGILKTSLPGNTNELVVPKSAVLWTGKKSVVYVMTPHQGNQFRYQEIELGPEAGDYYVALSGLKEGDVVVAHGVFKIDAAAQLQGKPSMMNPKGATTHTGHDHSITQDTQKLSDFQIMPMPAVPEDPLSVDGRFGGQLNLLVMEYLKVKDALVEGSVASAQGASAQLLSVLESIEMGSLDGASHTTWMKLINPIESGARLIRDSEDLDKQRLGFINLSNGIRGSIKSFEMAQVESLYVLQCPMANNDQGAIWISSESQVRNPFFGDKMLTCGSVIEEINYQ